MRHRTLGRTGLRVSELCLGTLTFGGDADPTAAAAIFKRARDAGVNFIDTADCYADGRSERALGDLLQGCRSEIVLATKVFYPLGPDYAAQGLSRRHILTSIDASLRRLKTDYVDLYYAHSFDAETPLEETLETMDLLVRQGKVRFPAVSNWAAWQMAKALGLSTRHAWAAFACVQPMYSLLKRQVEVEILPFARAEGLAVVPYGALAGGLLTGKYSGGARPAVGRLLQNATYAKRYAAAANHEVAARFAALAVESGVHPATLGVAWVRSRPGVTATLIGARSVEQLEPQLKAVDFDLGPDLRERLEALSPAPPPPTDRAEEAAAPPPVPAEPRVVDCRARAAPGRSSGLSRAQLREFEQQGFVGPLEACGADEMRETWARIQQAVFTNESMRRGGSIHWHEPVPRLDALYEFCTRESILDPVASVLGNNLLLWRSRFIVKGPGGAEIPWHQDLHYFEQHLEPVQTVSLWVALEDADRRNACIRVIPGSHRAYVPHVESRTEAHEDFPMNVDPSRMDPSWAIQFELRAGQFLLFDQGLVHGSAPNRSDRSRAALSMRLTTPLVRLKPPYSDFPILVRGVDRYGFNRTTRPLA